MSEAFSSSALSLLLASLGKIERGSTLSKILKLKKMNVDVDLRIRVFTEFITKLMEDGRLNVDGWGHAMDKASADKESRLCNNLELEKLVTSRGQWWTPKLETI
jgi:hypothetical protein